MNTPKILYSIGKIHVLLSGDVRLSKVKALAHHTEQTATWIQGTVCFEAIICQIITSHCIMSTRITHTQGIMRDILTSARQR